MRIQAICMNCKHFWVCTDDVSVCGVEGVEMDPNDSCNCFEVPITKAMIEKYSLDNNVSLIEAGLNLYGYGIV